VALNFSIVDRFVSEYGEVMHDRTLLRHDRYDILVSLRQTLWEALRDAERFEAELHRMLDSIDGAKDFDVLRKYHATSVEGVKIYFEEEQTVADVHDLFRIVRDRLTSRVLTLVEEEMAASGFGRPPSDYCWIGLGSEGRDEQTFRTDQDNMLVYEGRGAGSGDGPCSPERYYEEFSNRVMERLSTVGFEKCKGGTMPSNEKWRGSVEDWKERIEKTLQGSELLELLDLIIMTDARVMHGDRRLFDAVLERFFALLKENRHIMKEITEAAVAMPTALGFFGKFRLETEGDHKGMFNLKVLGWSPLIMSVRALALAEGLYETNTLKRIKRLREMNVVKKETASDLIEAYLLFARFRIMSQIGQEGGDGQNYIDPARLAGEESGKLRKAMKTVEAFQKYLHEVVLFGEPL
jgi:signal-transduction protein with cAMP-binding, CBS, and nucleotidyltransferase domain